MTDEHAAMVEILCPRKQLRSCALCGQGACALEGISRQAARCSDLQHAAVAVAEGSRHGASRDIARATRAAYLAGWRDGAASMVAEVRSRSNALADYDAASRAEGARWRRGDID